MFINPKYVGLSIVAAFIFFILSIVQATRIKIIKEQHNHTCNHSNDHTCHHDHGTSPFTKRKLLTYVVIVFPLVTSYFLPAKFLDAAIVEKKGGTAILTSKQQTTQAKTDTVPVNHDINNIDPGLANQKAISQEEYQEINQELGQSDKIIMSDYLFSTYYDNISIDIENYEHKTIELKGFVYKEDGLQPNQLVISRFLITHCIADAGIIGFLSEFPEAEILEEDTWIEASGIIVKTSYNGVDLPMIKIKDWKIIDEPEQPYVYPLNIK